MRTIGGIMLVFCVGTNSVPAQNTFIAHFDSVQMGHNGPASSVVELVDGGFLVSGIQKGHDGDTTGRTHVILRRTDSLGRVIHQSEVHHNVDQTFNNGLLGAMVRNDSLLVTSITRYDPYSWDCGLYLYQFDENGDTVTTKQLLHYQDQDSIFVQHWQTIQTRDGGFVLCGIFGPPDDNGQALLLRTNSQGDTLWIRIYGYANEEENAYSLCQLKDDGFAISAIHLGNGPSDNHTLIRTDSLGNQLWRRQYGNLGHAIPSVRAAPDSTIITFSDYRTSTQPWVDEEIELRKWDMNGDTLWSKRSHLASRANPMDFEILEDGSIICSMEYEVFATIAKFSPNGDSLWTRQYLVFDGPNNNYQNIPYDIDPTSDGGFVMCGETEQGSLDPHPGLQTMFIIKTDSMGCVVPGCHTVGVQEYSLDLQDNLSVWPNPVAQGGNVQIELELPPNTELQGQLQLVVQDALGREVFSSSLPGRGAKGEALSTTRLPTGLYHLHLHDDNTWLAGAKLVVE